jgi:16S rRNA (uracil1498-N3)-methyltransferase
VFYSETIDNGVCTLTADEARHCLNVMRHGKGDTVKVFNGAGKVLTARIIDTKKCLLEIIDEQELPKKHGFLHVAIAPTKNADRMEWFVEKAVETGVDAITPLICQHSERRTLKIERLEKTAIAAMKQSLNLIKPEINSPVSFEEFIGKQFEGQKYIAHCGEKTRSFANEIASKQSVVIMIGPEGDFSEQEIQQAMAAACLPVSLGNSRLRTETAGIVACVIAAQCFMKQLSVKQ